MSNSQCDSGCDSGWTSYFDEPTVSLSQCETEYEYPEENCRGNAAIVEKEREEDRSMLSDASSGPRYYNADDQELCTEIVGFCPGSKVNETNSYFSQGARRQSYLDDTATSSIEMSINKQRNTPQATRKAADKSSMDFSNGFRSSHFEGKPAFYNTFGFVDLSPSPTQKKLHRKKQVTSREDNGMKNASNCKKLQFF